MQNQATPTQTGERVELGRYKAPDGERVLVGQRVDGIVRVTDEPAKDAGRRYLVEEGLQGYRELALLVADYRAQAKQLGDCPMRRSLLGAALEAGEMPV